MLWLLCTVSELAVTNEKESATVISLDQITSIYACCLTDLGKPRAQALPGKCATKGEQVENKESLIIT